jgi:hypothetical protein
MEKSVLVQKFRTHGRTIGVIALSLGSSVAFAVDADPTATMAPLQAQFIGYIAAAGLAGTAIMAAAMGWDVGMSVFKKFMKKGAK